MKESNFLKSLLILGFGTSRKEIDVYLQPLFEELEELWAIGVDQTYDSVTNELFQLYAILLWTINDLFAYGDLFKWSVKDYQTCTVCKKDKSSFEIR